MLGSNNPLGSGVVNITAGTLIAGAPAMIGSPLAGGGTTLSNNVLLGGNFSLSGAAPLTFNGTATLTAGITLTANGTTTFTNGIGEFGGSRAIALDGVGTLVLAQPEQHLLGRHHARRRHRGEQRLARQQRHAVALRDDDTEQRRTGQRPARDRHGHVRQRRPQRARRP